MKFSLYKGSISGLHERDVGLQDKVHELCLLDSLDCFDRDPFFCTLSRSDLFLSVVHLDFFFNGLVFANSYGHFSIDFLSKLNVKEEILFSVIIIMPFSSDMRSVNVHSSFKLTIDYFKSHFHFCELVFHL